MARSKSAGGGGGDELVPRADPKKGDDEALIALIEATRPAAAAAKTPAPADEKQKDEPESLGFALRLESGKALLELRDKPLGGGVTLGRLEMEIPKVKFPFDVSGGAERFRSQRCVLRSLVLHLEHDSLTSQLERPSVKDAGFFDVEAAPENGALTVTGHFKQGSDVIPFSFCMAPVIMAPRELGLLPFDERVYGECKLPAARLPWLLIQALGGLPLKTDQPVFDVVAMSVRELLPRYGWKIPDTSDIGLIQAEISKTGWVIACGRGLLGDAKTESRIAFAVEARAPFESIETLLYKGEDEKAFKRYRKFIEEEVPHRFAVRRYLQLAAAEELRHEEGRSVAEEALLNDAENIDALLFLAHYALREGDQKGAAQRYSQAATALWAQKSDRAAALCDVRAAEVSRSFDTEGARKALGRTLKKRKSDRRALAESFALERDDENYKAATSHGERLLRALPDDERFAVHLELGEMLLDHDLKKAKLHAERALRARMDDPNAIRLVARLFAKSGDVPRAVRYLSRLSERFIALGDMNVATAIELEIAEQLERTENEPGFDPRTLLARYQRVLTLDPTRRPAILRTAQLAYALGELPTAKRWYEELAVDSDPVLRAEASFRLGEIAFSEKRDEDAESAFEAALQGPFGQQAYAALRKIYETRGDVQAMFLLERQLGANTDDLASRLEHHLRAANLAAQQRMPEAEIDHLEAALTLVPSDAVLKRRLLEAIRNSAGPEQVEVLLAKWAPKEHEPTTRAEWFLELANLRENRGDLQNAKVALDQAIKADPMSTEANEALYVLCQKLDEPYGAFAALGNLARYRHATDEAKAEIRITQAELLAGPLTRRDEARAYLLRALIDVPHHVRGLKLLGELAEEQNDNAMAEDAWRRFLETGAEDGRARAFESLGRLARARGDTQEQFNHLFELWQLTSEDKIFDELRAVLKERGDFQRLVLLLKDAVESTSGEKSNEYRWQTVLVLRDSVGDWASAREAMMPLTDLPGTHGDLARHALVELAENEGRADLLAEALEKRLNFALDDEEPGLKLRIARAYREAQSFEAAQVAYAWLLNHDPKQDEALAFLAERAETTGNAELAFTHQLARFAAGIEDALPALARIADTVPSNVLIANIDKLNRVPARFALDVAGRLDAEGYSQEAREAIERALTRSEDRDERFELIHALARIDEGSLRNPERAIDTLRKELDRAPDHAAVRDAMEAMIERSGTPRQRAELVLDRAIASGAVTQTWTAFEALVEAAPDHERLGSLFADVALHPALRPRVIEFLMREDAPRIVGDRVRSDVLLSIHDSSPLPTPALELLARDLRARNEGRTAQRLFAELSQREPQDDARFAEWQAGAQTEDERRETDLQRLQNRRQWLSERGDHRALAELLLAAIAGSLLGQETLIEVRDLLERAEDIEGALKVAGTITRAFPQELAHWIRRAELALGARHADAVIATLEDLRHSGDGLEVELAMLEKRFAHALLEQGAAGPARQLLEVIVKRDPRDDQSYDALAQTLEGQPAALLPYARARIDVSADALASTRAYLALAVRAPDDGAALGALALLAEAEALDAEDVETAFQIVGRQPDRLSEVWDWSEQLIAGFDHEGKRKIAELCHQIGDEAADEIRAALLGSIPVASQQEPETLYLARRLDRTQHADMALSLLKQAPFERILQSSELSALWLDVAATTHDTQSKLELLGARAKVADASLRARVDYAQALVDAHDQAAAFTALEALVQDELLDTDERSESLRKTHRHLLYLHARDSLAANPALALSLAGRLLADAPDSEEAWLLSVDAARLSKEDERLIELLRGRALSADLFAELGNAYYRTARPLEAANALLDANALTHKREWVDRALTLLEVAGDEERLASELVRHSVNHPNETVMLEKALGLYEQIGDLPRAAELSARLFEANPSDDAAFERQRALLAQTEDAQGLVRMLEKRLALSEGDARRELALQVARLYIEKLFAHEEAEQLLARELKDERATQLQLYGIFRSTGDNVRASAIAKKLFEKDRASDEDYARHRKHVEEGGSTIDLFELLEARLVALPQEARESVAIEAATFAMDRLHDADAAEHSLKLAFTDEKQLTLQALALYDRFGDEARAARSVKRAFALDPGDDALYSRYRTNVEKKGDTGALISLLEARANAMQDPGRSQLALEAARLALDKLKDVTRAGEVLDAFFGEVPTDLAALQLRIALQLRQGKDLEAMGLLRGLAGTITQANEKASVLLQAAGIAERIGAKKDAASLWATAFLLVPTPEEALRRTIHVAELEPPLRAEVQVALLPFLQSEERTDVELALADYYEAAGSLSSALDLAKAALSRDPESPRLRARVGDLYEKQGDTGAVLQLLSEQHATSMDRAERHQLAMKIAARAENDVKDLEQAEHFYRQAAKDDPSATGPLIELIRLYGARNASNERAETMETLIQILAPSKARGEACIKLGELRAERGELDKAALSFLHAFAEAVSVPAARRSVKLATKRGLYVDEAIRALSHVAEACEVEQERIDALRDAAEIVADSKSDYKTAATLFQQALSLGRATRDDHLRLVEWRERGGDVRGALEELFQLIDAEESKDSKNLLIKRAQALVERSGDAKARNYLSRRLMDSGRLGESDRLAYLGSLLDAGEIDDVRTLLAQLYVPGLSESERNRIEQVFVTRKQIDLVVMLVLGRALPDTRGQAMCEAATILENADEADRAYALYTEALNDRVELDEKVLTHIAALAERRNDDQLLSAVYLRIAESTADEKTRANAYFAMAKLWLDKKDAPRADDCLQACLRLEPEHKEARRMRARLLVQAGKAQEAQQYLGDAADLSGEDPAWIIEAAKGAGDASKARAILQPLIESNDAAFWALFELESGEGNDAAVVRMLLDRLEGGGAIDALDRLRLGAEHARKANISAAEEKLLGALHSDGITDPKIYARLAELTLARSDLDSAYRWTVGQATHAANDAERAEALQAAGDLALKLGKNDEARRQLEAAFNLNPTQVPLLEKLFEVYKAANEAERILMVGERLVIVEPQRRRPQSFYLALADAAEKTGTDAARTMELYQLAASAEPLSVPMLERAITAADGAAKHAERLEWEEERLSHVQATAEDYARLGSIARDRMQDNALAERYFRLARSVDPKALGPLMAIAGLIAGQKEKTQEAIALYKELAQRAPTDPEPYRLLARLYGQEQDVDRTFQYYDLLRALDPADEEAERFISAAHRVLTELPPRGLGKNELGQIADPGLLTQLQQFFGPLAAQAEMLYATDITRLGLSDQDIIQLDQGFGRRLALLMQRMGGRALEVLSYRAKVGGRDAIIEPGAPARLIVSSDTPDMPPRATNFVVCRALAFLALGHLLPNRLPASDLATLLGLLGRRFVPDLEVKNVPADRAAFVVERFRAITPDEAWAAHLQVARGFATGAYAAPTLIADIDTWVSSGERTADRWALLMCGDLAQAFSATKQVGHVRTQPLPPRGSPRLSAIAARPDLLDLLSFGASDTYLSVRQALGLTLRR